MSDGGRYDSRPETYEHIGVVREYLTQVIIELLVRASEHDASKLVDPELATFDEFTPRLRHSTFGSDEYKGFLVSMGEGLAHHYAHNAHHPEFGEAGMEWRPVVGLEGYYEVSSFGDIRSVERVVARSGPKGDLRKSSQFLKAQLTPKGYLRVQLAKDSERKNYMVHQLVASAFIPNPEGKPEVNHLDGNKKNNRVDNLEWVTPSENQQHAYDTGLKEPAVKYVVYCPDLDLTAFGTQGMERALHAHGVPKATAGGIWTAMDRGIRHCGLRFEGTLLAEWRRSRCEGMTLMDLIEMICDWLAATRRHADGDIRRSIEINQERFGYGDELKRILHNTVDALEAGS